MALKTHKPSGRAAWPLILIEGGEKTGKTYAAALLTASPRVGRSYWIEFGAEGVAEEYGAIPGVRYEVVEHDGSFAGLYTAVEDVQAEALKALEAGEKPMVLVIDTMTAEWDLLKDWATNRAKGSKSNQKKLAADPHAEIVVSNNYWNDANARHRKLMALLMTFPGIVVITARGKEVAAIDEQGRPIEGKREYRVEGQKGLGYDVSCWVRLSRDAKPIVVGMRSVRNGMRPGIDPPKPLRDDWNLEWLIFEALGLDPATAEVRKVVETKQERMPEQIRDEAVRPSTGFERLGELFAEANHLGYESVIVANERGQDELLVEMLKRLGKARQADVPATQDQHKHMHALWHEAAAFEDRDERLRFTSEIVGRRIESSSTLTSAEADRVIDRLKRYVKANTPPDDGQQSPNGKGELAGTGAKP
jgi:hypothetical protein